MSPTNLRLTNKYTLRRKTNYAYHRGMLQGSQYSIQLMQVALAEYKEKKSKLLTKNMDIKQII